MDSDSQLLKESFNSLPILKKENFKNLLDYIDGTTASIGIAVPILSAVPTIRKTFGDIRKRNFLKRCIIFLCNLAIEDVEIDKLNSFMTELGKHSEEEGYETLTEALDKFNNFNKADILANLVRASVNKDLDPLNFLRACNALEKVNYSDLKYLHKYTTDYFEEGLNESLLCSGLIKETGKLADDNDTDNETNYGISKIGEEILRYGLNSKQYKYISRGEKVVFFIDG